MRIEFHPKPDGMQHINLMFCAAEPEPEDLWVREQLQSFPVPPKRILHWEREGQEYEVLQYGQCVIGNVMFYIEKHKGVVDKIRSLCHQELTQAPLPQAVINELVSQVALEFHKESRFTVDNRGELTIDVDREKLQNRIRELLSATIDPSFNKGGRE